MHGLSSRRFVQVMLPLHPEAAEAARQQQTPVATPVVPSAFELYHYNGLGSAGHAHKRALRVLTVDPSATRGQPLACDGLGAVIQTRCARSQPNSALARRTCS